MNIATVRARRRAGGGADGAKASFLAAMSHEMRTPLNAIIGFAEIMDGELFGPVTPEPYKAYVHDILLSARSALQTIEDVLEISRAEAGDLVLRKREVALQAQELDSVHARHRKIDADHCRPMVDHLAMAVGGFDRRQGAIGADRHN